MRNLKVCIAYNGAAYHGFQRQSNALTIQQVIEDRLRKLLKAPTAINGCSRTDTGVHAKQFFFSFRTGSSIPCDGFVKGMNALLPDDIAVLSCEDADEDFHARFSAKGKEYIYRVKNTPQRDVFTDRLALWYHGALDERAMNKAAKLFIGEHDFAAFCKAEAKEHLRSTVREIYDFSVRRENDEVIFTVSGSGFLHNMVRIMVGTLIYVSEGKRTESDILHSLETGVRETAGKTIDPRGLYLNRVFY